MSFTIQRSRIAAIHDVIMAGASFIASLYLRLGSDIDSYPYLLEGTLVFCILSFCIFSSLRLYRGIWRYASIQDLIAITKAVSLIMLCFFPAMFLLNRLDAMPRSLICINWLTLIAFLGAPRFLYRIIKDHHLARFQDNRIPVLLAGVNNNAELFLRESTRKDGSEYRVVGVVDGDRAKIGREIYNIPVFGDFASIRETVEKLKAKGTPPQKILITSDYIDGEMVRHILETAEELGLSVARLPRLSEFRNSLTGPIPLRPLALEDLLGRPQNALDRQSMQLLIQGKKVLVTGAGGTIGGELVRQIARFKPSYLTLVDNGEYNLYAIDKTLEEAYTNLPRTAKLADIRERAVMNRIFAEVKPDLVFHAAALKHVPLMEENCAEAALTNVLGTKNIADCCRIHNVKEMVLVSTDKAVNPTNVMGTTKRIAECYTQALGQAHNEGTQFVTVRFGNVLGSSGSVVPLFQRQLAEGGPITITHPDIERYFMTVREAVELVLQASALASNDMSKQSPIFVLDMGKPVRIRDLASQMIRLTGLREGEDITIEYTGLRPGEKLHEELFHLSEALQKTTFANILLASSRPIDIEELDQKLLSLFAASRQGDISAVRAELKHLVPEFTFDTDLAA